LLSGLIVLGLIYIRLTVVNDDPAGVTAMAIVTTTASCVVTFVAARFENNIKIKVSKS
jgi:spore maturation protein SpmA